MNDVVTEAGQSYVALMPSAGVDPAADVLDSGGNWSLMAAAGTTNFLGSNTLLKSSAGSGAGADCTVGSIMLNISTLYGTNYLPADGRTLSDGGFPVLFGLIGYTYGGDGSTVFAIPDLTSAAANNTQYLVCVTGENPT